MKNGIWQSHRLDFVNINVYAKCYKNIPHGPRDGRLSETYFTRTHNFTKTSAKPRPMENDILQSLWARSCQDHCVCQLSLK